MRRVLALLLVFALILPVSASNGPKGYVALTFDDGPSGEITERLLDGLKERHVKATFFVCCYRIDQYPETLAAIAQDGHEIGLHSCCHQYMNKMTAEEIAADMDACAMVLAEYTGLSAKLFRPPGGLYNDALLEEAEKAGYSILLWSVDPQDWDPKRKGQVASYLERNTGPGDIVLLGYFLLLAKVDAGDGRRILEELKRRGAKTAIDLVTENSDRYGLVRECLPYVDYLIVNEVEAARIVGREGASCELAQALLDLGVRERVVIHEPAKGMSLVRGGACVEVPSFRLPEGFITDKTGAGDAYCAGVLTGIFHGLSDGEILRRGRLAAVGALSASGATAGVRGLAALEALYGRFES